ncbi:hypothetical protein EIP91_001295 [Steccherinum ochraceum]|uniref:CHAT domain-containing protein n=1 Tax=Steccherinum ochraceum TaxID=92696 RepID=A0A4R0RMU5_9APHY|nr:hypothetical protein EIP91_001295 [Steccherinum ochraceum]
MFVPLSNLTILTPMRRWEALVPLPTAIVLYTAQIFAVKVLFTPSARPLFPKGRRAMEDLYSTPINTNYRQNLRRSVSERDDVSHPEYFGSTDAPSYVRSPPPTPPPWQSFLSPSFASHGPVSNGVLSSPQNGSSSTHLSPAIHEQSAIAIRSPLSRRRSEPPSFVRHAPVRFEAHSDSGHGTSPAQVSPATYYGPAIASQPSSSYGASASMEHDNSATPTMDSTFAMGGDYSAYSNSIPLPSIPGDPAGLLLFESHRVVEPGLSLAVLPTNGIQGLRHPGLVDAYTTSPRAHFANQPHPSSAPPAFSNPYQQYSQDPMFTSNDNASHLHSSTPYPPSDVVYSPLSYPKPLPTSPPQSQNIRSPSPTPIHRTDYSFRIASPSSGFSTPLVTLEEEQAYEDLLTGTRSSSPSVEDDEALDNASVTGKDLSTALGRILDVVSRFSAPESGTGSRPPSRSTGPRRRSSLDYEVPLPSSDLTRIPFPYASSPAASHANLPASVAQNDVDDPIATARAVLSLSKSVGLDKMHQISTLIRSLGFISTADDIQNLTQNLDHALERGRIESLEALGRELHDRFCSTGDVALINEAAECYRTASRPKLAHRLPEDTRDPAIKSLLLRRDIRLCQMIITRCIWTGSSSHDLDIAIDQLRRSIWIWPGGRNDVDRVVALEYIGRGLCHRAHMSSGTTPLSPSAVRSSSSDDDIQEALQAYREGLAASGSTWDRAQISVASALGEYWRSQYDSAGNEKDLLNSISVLRGPVRLVDRLPDHSVRTSVESSCLIGNLAAALNLLYHRTCVLEDRDYCIESLYTVLARLPSNHPLRPQFLAHLGDSLLCRYDQSDSEADYMAAVGLLKDAYAASHSDDSLFPMLSRSLGSAISAHARKSGKTAVVDEAIIILEKATSVCPSSHPEHGLLRGHLGQAYGIRYTLQRAKVDERSAMDAFGTFLGSSLERSHHSHQYDVPALYGFYGNLLLYISKTSGESGPGLNASIDVLKQAIELSQRSMDPDRRCLSFLRDREDALQERLHWFNQADDEREYMQAVKVHSDLQHMLQQDETTSGEAGPSNHVVSTMTPLTPTLSQTARDVDALDSAEALPNQDDHEKRKRDIEVYRKAIEKLPRGTHLWTKTVSALAHALQRRFIVYRYEGDIEDAIETYRNILEDPLNDLGGHLNRLLMVHHLSQALSIRSQIGKHRKRYMEENFRLLHETLSATETVISRPWVAIHVSLLTDFGRVCTDMVNAGYVKEASEGPLTDMDKSRTRVTMVLDRAVQVHEAALKLIRSSSRTRYVILGDLADALHSHALHNEARSAEYHTKALDAYIGAVEGSPNFGGPVAATKFAKVLLSVDSDTFSAKIIEKAFIRAITTVLDNVLAEGSTTLSQRLETARVRAALLRRFMSSEPWHEQFSGQMQVIRAYREALNLLQFYVAIFPSIETQYESLLGKGDFVLEAAAFALQADQTEAAVEMLEQGRALLFSHMRGFRLPLDVLKTRNKPIAIRFLLISRQLEDLTMTSDLQLARTRGSVVDAKDVWLQRTIDVMLDRKESLQDQLHKVTSEIHQIAGFEDFLRAKPYRGLHRVAEEGPVIILNHDRNRCNAVIIHKARLTPVVVELPRTLYQDAFDLEAQLRDARSMIRACPKRFDAVLKNVLRELWDSVVGLVCDALEDLGVPPKSRIWWCPTSVLARLPIHAAGPFTRNGVSAYLPDLYVSSYTPTLAALMDARTIAESTSQWGHLIVRQTGGSPLPRAAEEMGVVARHLPSSRRLQGENVTRSRVLRSLNSCHWVHLICHGHLKARNPFQSSFELFGGQQLTLFDIMQAKHPNAQFAFLSACHSAQQSPNGATEEVLHLASAMQFSGFKSVVGTMWEMNDEDGPALTDDFYALVMKQPVLDADRHKYAAHALRSATMRLRNSGVGLERWVNYIHIGA